MLYVSYTVSKFGFELERKAKFQVAG